MRVRVRPVDHVEGEVEALPSKSYTHRLIFSSLLATGESQIEGMLIAGTTLVALRAARKFGAEIEGALVRPPDRLRAPPYVYCGGSGTTIRLATAVAALVGGPTILYGNSSLNRRPMAPLVESLRELGAEVLSRDGFPPVAVRASKLARGVRVRVDGSKSSQFVSALLLIAPLLELEVEVVGELKSSPYVDMTVEVMSWFGARVHVEGRSLFIAEPLDGYRPARVKVPGDFSLASFPLALGALAGRVRVTGLSTRTKQGDRAVVEILREMGAKVRVGDAAVEVERADPLEGVEVNCSDTPDLVPVLAALAAHARGVTVLKGVEHLAYKESDRLRSLVSNLRRLGVHAEAREGSLVVRGGRVRGGTVSSYGDHRIAMAMAVAATRAEGPVVISGFEKHRESYPSFIDDLRKLGVVVEVIGRARGKI
ncbi:MAG: 3-phosphoshikimate 1-carboxyvinyltransferase [Fervidicoccaceae archaeon]